jgi:ribosome biogenesis protein BMS1
MLSDRFDTVETIDDPETNTVSFYGYIRGTYLDVHNRIHINGLGDFDIASAHKIDDPCPIELKRTVKEKQAIHVKDAMAGLTNKKAMRTLKDREKVLYAPFSNIGALNFEKTTGYITIPDKQVIYTRINDENEDQESGRPKV